MFIILSLPRSRTAWLSAFLSYPPKRCGHDVASDCGSIAEFINKVSELDGTCETGAVIGWKLIRTTFPDATIIVIRRALDEIRTSLARFGVSAVEGELGNRRMMLDACSASPGVVTLDFQDLGYPDICRGIFETCLNLPFDEEWYERYANTNIQIDVVKQIARLRSRQAQLTSLKQEVSNAVSQLDGGRACLGLH